MKINVGVVFGGKSTEHEISIISALTAIKHFDKEKYNVIPIYISKDNYFYIGKRLLNIENYKNIELLKKQCKKAFFIKDSDKLLLARKNKVFIKIVNNIDCIFLITHGSNVEDGTLSGFFNMYDIPYVSSNVCSSALCMDKYYTKCILNYHKINTIPGLEFNMYENIDKVILKSENKLGYPLIIKPNNLGSSIGICTAYNRDELIDAINSAFMFSKYILIEKKIEKFKEINCSVIGDTENIEVSCLEEVNKNDDILSFSDKYLNEGTKEMESASRIIPARINKKTEMKIKKLSKKIFKIFKSNCIVRIDYLFDEETNDIYVEEINNIPGSLANYLWKEKYSYKELIDKLISIAFKIDKENKKINYIFDSNVLNKCNSIKK